MLVSWKVFHGIIGSLSCGAKHLGHKKHSQLGGKPACLQEMARWNEYQVYVGDRTAFNVVGLEERPIEYIYIYMFIYGSPDHAISGPALHIHKSKIV